MYTPCKFPGGLVVRIWSIHCCGSFNSSFKNWDPTSSCRMAQTKQNCTLHKHIHYTYHKHLPMSIQNYDFFFFLRAAPVAYGSSQARGQIGATAASICHSRSYAGSLTHSLRPGINPASSWILIRFVSAVPQQELPNIIFNSCMGLYSIVWTKI